MTRVALGIDQSPAYTRVLELHAEISAYDDALRLLRWDQKVMAPARGAREKSRQMGVLAAARERLIRSSRLADAIAAAEEEPASPGTEAHLREIRRRRELSVRLPDGLPSKLAAATSRGQAAWRGARADGGDAAFLPALADIVALKQEEGAALAGPDAPCAYDALLQAYEPGITVARLTPLFDELRQGLTAIPRSRYQPDDPGPRWSEAHVLGAARDLATCLGLEPDSSRIDLADHPFACALPRDYRIAIRVSESDPLGAILFTAHEVGHALYEQALDRAGRDGPASVFTSMALHESQSRLFETHVLRNPGFARSVGDMLARHTGCDPDAVTRQLLKRLGRKTTGSLKRMEAGTAEYDLHIMLRFDLERALIDGSLTVPQLPEAWRALSLDYLGREPDGATDGVLQDEHWAVGHFGYFPCYTLANIYAANLWSAMAKDRPDLCGSLALGETTPVTEWLYEKVQRHGRHADTETIVTEAIGKRVSTEPYLIALSV